MISYPLIEHKLRRYFYLGHEYSIYVPRPIKASYCEQRHHDDITGVRIIGKIVKKNKPEEINSIIPIILKIKKEGKLLDDRLLIFSLAICARFNLEQCLKMVSDAYEAIPEICTNGLKLLMFVKFCKKVNTILHNEGYLPSVTTGFSRRSRKALSKWYLNRDPLLTTEQIVRHKSYDGLTHKDVMSLIHIQSKTPHHNIFIVYTKCGIEKVEEIYGTKLKNIQTENENETFENKQLKFIYNFLRQVEDMNKMDENKLRTEIELHRWGQDFEYIPKNMLTSTKILSSLVMHMPLRTLLENTFYLAKHRLFRNSTPDIGLWEFILRFNNTNELQKSQIHPIESFIEYVKYSRTSLNILKIQNNILKKQTDSKTESSDNKLRMIIKIKKTNSLNNDTILKNSTNLSYVQCENKLSQAGPSQLKNLKTQKKENDKKINVIESSLSKGDSKKKKKSKDSKSESTVGTKKEQKQNKLTDTIDQLSSLNMNSQLDQAESNAGVVVEQVQSEVNENVLIFMKPPPKLVDQMLKFLSQDLLNKTLEILKPSGHRLLIAYDSREYLKNKKCACTKLLGVDEAITLITLSLIYPDKLPNKPTVRGLGVLEKQCTNNEIEIDYTQSLTFTYLESILYKPPGDKTTPVDKTTDSDVKDISNIEPLSTMVWAKENNKQYDVFVFLGTNKMNLRDIKKTIKEYQAFFNKKVKVIVCCLNGKHRDQSNFRCGNMLFIVGFDKNVGKLINSFMNYEF